MKYIVLKDYSVKYKLSNDKLYIRMGIWDFSEIFLDKKSFDQNNADFKKFIKLFIQILDGKKVNINYFSDQYYKKLINELLSEDLLIKIQDTDSKNNVVNICVISDDESISFMKKYNIIMNISNVTFENINKKFDISHDMKYIVILPNPYLMEVENLNKRFFKKNITWSMAIQDNLFMHFSTFVPNITACFNCFEIGNSLRMYEYENYVNYLKNEQDLDSSKIKKESICYLYQTSLLYATQNYEPLEGKLLSIYVPNLEYNLEPLHKSSLCALDGLKAKRISEDLNLNAQNIISEILKEKGKNNVE